MKIAFPLALAALGALSGTQHELVIGGITLGQSESSVIGTLGKPASRSVSETTDYLPVTLTYPGFTIGLDEQGVGRLLSSSSRYCTPVGACPGMRLVDVQRIYGPEMRVEQVDGAPKGYVFDEGCWLAFAVKSGNIDTIEVTCMP
ncbi:hypothetical protein [Lysobacter sp. GCM10012299]|uniref:hypothetical protein n=1 Tax=Lysobacter sp. GCM10012299 TaxID=3317333 RepID=UPI0036216B25